MSMHRTELYIRVDQKQELRRIGQQESASMAALVREAIDRFLNVRKVNRTSEVSAE